VTEYTVIDVQKYVNEDGNFYPILPIWHCYFSHFREF